MALFFKQVHNVAKKAPIYSWKKQQSFHTNHRLFNQPTVSEKPAWLKKFKLKQAAMQKDDGLPVFLKKGLPDKILFNLTLGLNIVGFFWSMRILNSLDDPPKQE